MIGRKWPARKSSFLTFWLAAVLLVSGPVFLPAKEVYHYRDKRGVRHFTDAPTDTRFRPYRIRGWIVIGGGSARIDPAKLKRYIDIASKLYHLDPDLIKAVIKAESAFNPMAVSLAGARGLMQLMPDTAHLMDVSDVFNPRDNILGGSRYLRLLLDRFKGNLKLALAAYNIGPERVAREKKIPSVRETKLYVKRVLAYYRQYRKTK